MGDETSGDPAMLDELYDEAIEHTPEYVLGKLLAFIEQVRASRQAQAYFFKMCGQESLKKLSLVIWVRTRWASLYDLLERAIESQKVSL